jgi:choline dehydrogenase-like flavoprotein
MLIDARNFISNDPIQTDLCIIGAGPAGITIAREYLNTSISLCLVESGGWDFDANAQSLSDGTVVGDPYPPLTQTRWRQVGGAAHLWEAQYDYQEYGFRCTPLDEIDFEQRDWMPYSGWPFSKSHLDPFYRRAHSVCKIGPYAYDLQDWSDAKAQPLPIKDDRMVTKMSQYGSRNPFTGEYCEAVKQAENISVLVHATVTQLETDADGKSVTTAQIHTMSGNSLQVKARAFILAGGGIENARLLLLSNQQQPHGLGNHHDLVGRFFMERPMIQCGILKPFSRQLFQQTALYDIRKIKGTRTLAYFSLSEALIRQEKLMNNGALLFPKPLDRQVQASRSLRKGVAALRKGNLPETITHFTQVAAGMDYLLQAGMWSIIRKLPGLQRGDWSYLPLEKQRFSQFELIYQIEQAPDPNNRMVLGARRDRLDQPQAEIHWKLNPIDLETIHRVQAIWKDVLKQSQIGDLQLWSETGSLRFEKLAIHHHMGTTRMHPDPKQGVVDENGRLHSVANFFITGSSVFPTAGYANPTLTILALALRLADHVKTIIG